MNIILYIQKLNEKNSWNYDLIDHMGKLIKDESRGVNFQKVSCVTRLYICNVFGVLLQKHLACSAYYFN